MNSGIDFVPTANINIYRQQNSKKYSESILRFYLKKIRTKIHYKVSAAVKLENQFKCNPASLYYTISLEGGCVYVKNCLKETKDKV